jgi:hypothetical protein
MSAGYWSVRNIYRVLSIKLITGDPAFEVAALEFGLEAYDVFLEAFLALEFPGLEVSLDILVVELVNRQLADEGLGLRDDLFSVGVVDGPEAIGPELRAVDLVFVILVEDEVQDALGLDLGAAVGSPEL